VFQNVILHITSTQQYSDAATQVSFYSTVRDNNHVSMWVKHLGTKPGTQAYSA